MFHAFHIHLYNRLRDLNLKSLYPRIQYNYFEENTPGWGQFYIKTPDFYEFKYYWDMVEEKYVDPSERQEMLDLGK